MGRMERPRAESLLWVAAQFALLVGWGSVVATAQPSAPPFFSPEWVAAVRYGGVGFAGLALAQIAAAFHALGWNVTPMPTPRQGRPLVRSGIFRYVRHPIYGGLLLLIGGVSVARFSVGGLLLMVPVSVFFLLKSRYEEGELQKKFPEYGGYLATTKRFLPRIW